MTDDKTTDSLIVTGGRGEPLLVVRGGTPTLAHYTLPELNQARQETNNPAFPILEGFERSLIGIDYAKHEYITLDSLSMLPDESPTVTLRNRDFYHGEDPTDDRWIDPKAPTPGEPGRPQRNKHKAKLQRQARKRQRHK